MSFGLELLLSVATCVNATPSCTCVLGTPGAPTSIAETIRDYAAVFEGTVTRIDTVPDSASAFYSNELVVTLKVHRSWKGEFADSAVVETPEQTTMCGADFSVGGTYLIFSFARDNSGTHGGSPARLGEVTVTSKCTDTVGAGGEADKLLRELGPPLRVMSVKRDRRLSDADTDEPPQVK